jgi:hypothetical protein
VVWGKQEKSVMWGKGRREMRLVGGGGVWGFKMSRWLICLGEKQKSLIRREAKSCLEEKKYMFLRGEGKSSF